MKAFLYLLIALFILIATPVNSQKIVKDLDLAEDPIVGDVLNKATSDIQQLIASAEKNGDYVLEKNLSRVQLIINNLAYSLSKDLDKKIKKLTDAEKDAMNSLAEITQDAITNGSKALMETSEFLSMDVQDWLNDIPFIKHHIYISSIVGIGQSYQLNGIYTVTIHGNAFKVENQDSIFIDGKPLKDDDIIKNPTNEVTFNIPSRMLNGKFDNSKIKRIQFTATSYEVKKHNKLKKQYTYLGKLILLPKLPIIRYSLVLSETVDRWSDSTFDSKVGHGLLNPTSGNNIMTWTTIETSVPKGCLMLKDQVKTWKSPSLFAGCSPVYHFDDANNSVSANCEHQQDDRITDFYIQCKYRKPVSDLKDSKALLSNNGQTIRGGLRYNKTYISILPANYGSYVLELNFFNGRTITFTEDGEKNRVNVKVQDAGTDNDTGRDFKRLVVEIQDQD